MSFDKKNTLQAKVFKILSDKKWHCRGHEYPHVKSGQLAGGGGIQGLQRGTKGRPGYVIDSKNDYCKKCLKITRWDTWTGEFKKANAPDNLRIPLINRILEHYKFKDVVEERIRPAHELVIDHKFPMIRWGKTEEKQNSKMPEKEIENKFQLLKFDGGGNHNLLKSRACENCRKTSKRGKPFGIAFFYQGKNTWLAGVPKEGPKAEKGCIGCGWYDFHEWRKCLNETLRSFSK